MQAKKTKATGVLEKRFMNKILSDSMRKIGSYELGQMKKKIFQNFSTRMLKILKILMKN